MNGGSQLYATNDGGQTWTTQYRSSAAAETGDFCGGGGDPALTYSRRDHAFYFAQLCFFRNFLPSARRSSTLGCSTLTPMRSSLPHDRPSPAVRLRSHLSVTPGDAIAPPPIRLIFAELCLRPVSSGSILSPRAATTD